MTSKQLRETVNKNKQLKNALKMIQALYKQNNDKDEINNVIQKARFPIGMHLFITANFSELMELIYN